MNVPKPKETCPLCGGSGRIKQSWCECIFQQLTVSEQEQLEDGLLDLDVVAGE